MIYSKREDMTGKLSALVQSENYEKTYLAVVHGAPEEEAGEMRDLLFHDKMKNKSFVCSKKRSGVKEAILNYRVVDTAERADGNKMSLLEIKLVTGRTHQIRAHMAHIGHPLLGDGKYGVNREDRAKGYKFQALYAYKLGFRFKSNEGALGYLNGKRFQLSPADVWFLKDFGYAEDDRI
jgi:23S rRNA pseudouridine955/2504/2580 synthase